MKELLEILVYIMACKKGDKTFLGEKITISRLIMYIREKVAARTLLVSRDIVTEKINGLVIWDERDKSVYIRHIIADNKSIIRSFLDFAANTYPDWPITSPRKFSLRKYSQSQLNEYFYA